ncbi:MAG: carbon-nitrogen hydrolase family protein [Betaproteobacteria bacterium]|nr:carbon-nitrogen hydrolase family protein [Betaproteobacteria bacterium]
MADKVFKIAAVQMVSGHEVKQNLSDAGELIAEAARQGARLVGLPEYFCLMGKRDGDKVAIREAEGNGPIQSFLSQAAARHGVWLVGGTAPLASTDAGRVRNACLIYDDTGKQVARYDKIHLFGFQNGAERYDESTTIEAGDTPMSLDSPYGKLGFSVCYDLRFPELYRAFAPVDIIFVPSAFTATTGRAHWETLLRARAIENLAYVVAPAQGGTHSNRRATWGHSMIIDPWGEILACRDEGPGVVIAEIDLSKNAKVRASLPALDHRTLGSIKIPYKPIT